MAPEKDISVIPIGLYCYEILDVDEKMGRSSIKTCPYWSNDRSKPKYESGYCSFLEQGDEDVFGLLWDQVKECGINHEE